MASVATIRITNLKELEGQIKEEAFRILAPRVEEAFVNRKIVLAELVKHAIESTRVWQGLRGTFKDIEPEDLMAHLGLYRGEADALMDNLVAQTPAFIQISRPRYTKIDFRFDLSFDIIAIEEWLRVHGQNDNPWFDWLLDGYSTNANIIFRESGIFPRQVFDVHLLGRRER